LLQIIIIEKILEQSRREQVTRDTQLAIELGYKSIDEMNKALLDEQVKMMADIEVEAAIEMAASVGVTLVRADE